MPSRSSCLFTSPEVVPTLVAEVVDDPRQAVDDLLVPGHLAVEHAKRVRLDSTLAVAAHFRNAVAQRTPQRLDIGRTAAPVPDRVQDQLVLFHTAGLDVGHGDLDHLGVDGRARQAEGLDVQLVKLAVASLLGPLPAEHRPERVDLKGRVGVHQVVLDDGAHDPGGGLRPERQRCAVPVVEGVHLFGDDVGLGPQPPGEEPRLLEHRCPDLPVPVPRQQILGCPLQGLPDRDLVGKDVPGTADGPGLHRSSLASARYLSLYPT